MKRTFVSAGNYLVDINPGAIVLVTHEDGVTNVRNLHETKHQVVQTIVDGRRVKLAAGHEVVRKRYGENPALIQAESP